MERPVFESVRAYGRRFTDAAFWRPYVEEVCRRHRLAPCDDVRSGLPGTMPVFLVGNRWVVKFFSRLFGGAEGFAIEREIFSLLLQLPGFPASRLVVEGDLFAPEGGWHWPYLVSTRLPGTSLGEVYEDVSAVDREEIARYLGGWLKELHSIALHSAAVLRPDWTPFTGWLRQQRSACVENHRRWQDLPAPLIEQLADYLPPVDALLDPATRPLLLHCDMNADHLLGEFHEGRWIPRGIIDFGDAKVGDLLYELVAMHLDLFRCDKRLLEIFLRTYGSDLLLRADFPTRAMSFTLLHEFAVLQSIFERSPALRQVSTLDDLADRLWRV